MRTDPNKSVTEQKELFNASEIPVIQKKSIAVLPFVNMSPDKDQDYFCDGIAEEIINALVHIESFKVIARTSAFSFKGQQIDIREIGRILDVETVLEGSIRKDGNRLRITAQLIKTADGSHIWSERYDCAMKDVFAIQDEISLAILNNLKVKLLGETKAMITKRHSENLEAYNLYLRGTYCWQMMTIEGYKKASDYFEQALRKDPDYALAYVGFATVIIASTALKEGVAELEKAVDLSDGNPLAATILVLGYYLVRKIDQAEKLFANLKKRSETEYIPATSIYLVHRIRGEDELALQWLKRACTEHDTSLLWYRARQIRKGSKYMALLKEMGLISADKK